MGSERIRAAREGGPVSGGFARRLVQRPPWTDEMRIRASCTSCSKCLNACPEGILISGPARTPVLDFTLGACTFCGACAEACEDQVFRERTTRPWDLVAKIGQTCLLAQGVSCRSCTDTCDPHALIFDLTLGRVGAVHVMAELCTGCGACVGSCPVAAISIELPRRTEDAA